MNARTFGVTAAFGLFMLLLAADTASAQSTFYKPYGATRSGIAPHSGAGYRYVAPSYNPGLSVSTYRSYSNYYGLPRIPAYRYTTRVPYFSHIQPQYQTAYLSAIGISVPPLGSPYVGNPIWPSVGFATTPRSYARIARTGAIYRPYVTVSQFVYTPTYVPVISVRYPATYGAYGYSAFYGY